MKIPYDIFNYYILFFKTTNVSESNTKDDVFGEGNNKQSEVMKAKIYQDPEDKQGIVLSGKVVSFFLGIRGWNLVIRGSRVAEEHPDLFETVLDLNNDKMLKGDWGKESKSKAEINGDTTWLGFRIDSGVKVQIFEEDKEGD